MNPLLEFLIPRLPSSLVFRCMAALERRWFSARTVADRQAGQRDVDRKLDAIGAPDRILEGPFKGMRYVRRAFGSSLLPKILGCYEKELGATVEELSRISFDRIVDIGAAEGYYAVGLALRIPSAKVTTFELDSLAILLSRHLAHKNGVLSRLDARKGCTVEALRDAIADSKRPLIICDCEGAEDMFLDPSAVPDLHRAVIVVELHDFAVAQVSQRIRERFASSHRIETIPAVARTKADLPAHVQLADDQWPAYVNEGRPCPMEWFVMWPHVKEGQ